MPAVRIRLSVREGSCTYMSATLIHMSTRNITLALPADLIRRAKVYAAAHDTSISAMVAEMLGARVGLEDDYDTAWATEVEAMKKGLYSLKGYAWNRDELYERENLRSAAWPRDESS